MVPLLLLLIVLVIAWPIFAIFGGTLIAALWAHLNILIPTAVIALAYIAFLVPIATRNNIKLGGKFGEPLDPSRPIGTVVPAPVEPDVAPAVHVGIFDAPERLRPVLQNLAQPEQRNVAPSKASSPLLRLAIPVVLLILVGASLSITHGNSGTVAPSINVPTAAAMATSPGNWQVQNGQVTLPSTSGRNYLGEPIRLSATCLHGRLDLRFHYGTYLGADDGWSDLDMKTVIFKVGSEAPEQVRMSITPDKTAIEAGSKSGALISKFSSGMPFSIYTAPFNAEPINASFDTTGGREAMASLDSTCEPTTAYSSPIRANVTFNGDGGMIHVLTTGDNFPFTRNFPPGVEQLYGACRMAMGQNCEIELDLNGNKLARIWWARVPAN